MGINGDPDIVNNKTIVAENVFILYNVNIHAKESVAE